MFHVMWAGSVPCHVTGQCFISYGQCFMSGGCTVFHVMWMNSVSCHVDGKCFMSCGWKVFYVMLMDSV